MANHLLRALETNREIGVAMGIRWRTAHLTQHQAFDQLHTASQHLNRKPHDIATVVASTGRLPAVRLKLADGPVSGGCLVDGPFRDECDAAFVDEGGTSGSTGGPGSFPPAGRLVLVAYTWSFHPRLIESARHHGVHGYLAKSLPARELVQSLEAVHAGQVVISEPPRRALSAPGLNWSGRGEGLTDRESEILALITQGRSNAEVAVSYLSPNTVKSYIRSIYRKIGAGSRTQAVLWGVSHGFTPSGHRIDNWQG